jgi:hypothetical protein
MVVRSERGARTCPACRMLYGRTHRLVRNAAIGSGPSVVLRWLGLGQPVGFSRSAVAGTGSARWLTECAATPVNTTTRLLACCCLAFSHFASLLLPLPKCAVLCCAVLCCAVLCCAVLGCCLCYLQLIGGAAANAGRSCLSASGISFPPSQPCNDVVVVSSVRAAKLLPGVVVVVASAFQRPAQSQWLPGRKLCVAEG